MIHSTLESENEESSDIPSWSFIRRRHRRKIPLLSHLPVCIHLRRRVIVHRTNHTLFNQARLQMIFPVTLHRLYYRLIQVLNQLSLYNLLLLLPVMHLVTQPVRFYPFHFTHQLHRVISLLSVLCQVWYLVVFFPTIFPVSPWPPRIVLPKHTCLRLTIATLIYL